jgi:hypothetical protein
MNFLKTTISDLSNQWKGYAQANNSAINPYSFNTAWDILANSFAMQLLDLYANLENVKQNNFVQNYVGDQCDIGLYERGLPARGGQTYGTCVVQFNFLGNITVDTIFQSAKGEQYQVIQDLVITDMNVKYTLYAVNSGNSTYVSPNEYLTNINNQEQKCIVYNCVIGQLAESDQSCNMRILLANWSTNAPGTQSFYVSCCLEANSQFQIPVITQAVVVLDFITYNNISRLGIFALNGGLIMPYQLDLGLLQGTNFQQYSREIPINNITIINNYIQNKRFEGSNPLVGNCITWIVNQDQVKIENVAVYVPFTLKVNLISGFGFDTKIDIPSQKNDNTFITITLTIAQLIKRSFRNAICNYTYSLDNSGQTITNNQGKSIIPVSILLSAMLEQIGINGTLAQVLINIELYVNNAICNEILIPDARFSVDNVYFVYDINSYDNLIVTGA